MVGQRGKAVFRCQSHLRLPRTASRLVAKDDIVRVTPNADKTAGAQSSAECARQFGIFVRNRGTHRIGGGFDYKLGKFNRATQAGGNPARSSSRWYGRCTRKRFPTDSTVSDRPLRVGEWKPKLRWQILWRHDS